MANPPDFDQHLDIFRLSLEDAGFVRMAQLELEMWTGIVTVEWCMPATEEPAKASHTISVILPPGFPYRAPSVVCTDTDPPLGPSWHLTPGPRPELCLWDSQVGWQPYYSAQKLIHRVQDWFLHYHTSIWPTDSEVPDLHRYLETTGVVVIGEGWRPPTDVMRGYFTLWQPRKARPVQVALAVAPPNGTERITGPELRLADRFFPARSELQEYPGIWFRFPAPFVPPNTLADLLKLVDEVMEQPPGWARQLCINMLPKKMTLPGFPIAIGYADQTGAVRWLFLWAGLHKSVVGGNRSRWAREQYLPLSTIKSFQTAPAGKDDLLRRSAYISKTLMGKRVAVFGIGALGSSVSLLLAKAGIPALRLIDGDTLVPGNALRHVAGLQLIGYKKTLATDLAILDHNPDCDVSSWDASWERTNLASYIADCDLVVDATANTNFTLFLNQICIEQQISLLIATTYRRARVGRLVIRTTSLDPCFACYYNALDVWSQEEYPLVPPNPAESFIEDGCGVVTEEAVALDVEAVGNFAARAALAFLQARPLPGNLGILVNEVLPEAVGVLALSGAHWLTNRPRTTCPICRG